MRAAAWISTERSFQDFHDIFGDFLDLRICLAVVAGAGATAQQRGSDLRYDMTLTFEEAATGVSTKIKLPKQELCGACHGTGAKAGRARRRARRAAGAGSWRISRDFSRLREHARRVRAPAR
jgi:molecular chaperone DnaJ